MYQGILMLLGQGKKYKNGKRPPKARKQNAQAGLYVPA
jgi:hypothetical protein